MSDQQHHPDFIVELNRLRDEAERLVPLANSTTLKDALERIGLAIDGCAGRIWADAHEVRRCAGDLDSPSSTTGKGK